MNMQTNSHQTVLGLDMSTEITTVALQLPTGELQQASLEGPRPSRDVLKEAERLLQDAGVRLSDVEALAFGRGPGAFTGLRVAAGIAQGLALGLDIPLLPVSSLQALAWRVFLESGEARVVAALDARMNEIYWAAFECSEQGIETVAEESLAMPTALRWPAGRGDDWVAAGPGFAAYDALRDLAARHGKGPAMDAIRPDAQHVIACSRFVAAVPVEEGIPVYLRDEVAWKKA
ncbi:MAG: tRNA (adenosine(37)-N6)-threonylcarbamoyltransferase complex dimerization subunit type 1 TsaB [Gammaproteobacteria bacterium]|nr:tRNA (adenosine(37)-N6)-threonylcarbamoyltransferase complex dimerization subunit type 1 TsaB [Gammaproteobacteria bacterium]